MTQYIGYGELQQLWHSLRRLPEALLTLYIAEVALALGKFFILEYNSNPLTFDNKIL